VPTDSSVRYCIQSISGCRIKSGMTAGENIVRRLTNVFGFHHFQPSLDGFRNVCHCLFIRFALRHASRHGRYLYRIVTRFILFNDCMKFHLPSNSFNGAHVAPSSSKARRDFPSRSLCELFRTAFNNTGLCSQNKSIEFLSLFQMLLKYIIELPMLSKNQGVWNDTTM